MSKCNHLVQVERVRLHGCVRGLPLDTMFSDCLLHSQLLYSGYGFLVLFYFLVMCDQGLECTSYSSI
jgi:hypothetical protein